MINLKCFIKKILLFVNKKVWEAELFKGQPCKKN